MMQILDRRTFLALTGGATAAGLIGLPARAGAAGASVFTADAIGVLVDSVVVVGEEKALLIDAQLTAGAATALADMIAATGKALETIYVTHMHPDHVLGLDVLLSRFPGAKPVTHAAIQPLIAASAQGYLDFFSGTAPAGTFAGKVVIPDVMAADHLELEGERIEIIGPMHGDTGVMTALHIPALDTLVATDFAFADTHVWMAENTTPERVAQWRESLNKLEAIGAATVVPGHRMEGSVNDASVFAYTRAYLDQWEKALGETKTAEDLRAAMMVGNEALGLTFVLDRAVAAVYPG